MKKNLLKLAAVLAFFWAGCSDSDVDSPDAGTLALTSSVNKGVIVKSGRTSAANVVENFKVTLTSGAGEVIVYDKLSDMPSEVTLKVDSWTVLVSSGEFQTPMFDSPVYDGTETFQIHKDQQTQQSVVCTQANAGFIIKYTDEFKAIFDDYSTVLSSERGQLAFDETETRTGYFLPGAVSGRVQADGKEFVISTPIQAERQDLWTITINAVEIFDEGTAVITVTLDTGVNNKTETWTIEVDHTSNPGGGNELFISEYTEGNSFNKALELYNPTNAAIDLSNYSLKIYSNGNETANSPIALSGTVNAGETFIISHTQFALDLPSGVTIGQKSDGLGFNGDDDVELLKGDTRIDLMGVIGEKVEFGKDKVLRRKPAATAPSATFSLDDWEELPKNDVSGFGSHTTN
ncbi:MAG: DUF4493 domain-containing protein [Cytophagales bacterium]|nr:DUF4493 domain-containing protein [Cytophagales bacterium]